MQINFVDLAVFGLFILSAAIGIARGFTRETFGVVAWIGAALATIFGIIWSRPYIQQWIDNPFVADVLTGLIIFIAVLFILGSISRVLSTKVKGSLLGGLDRSLGLLFGLVRAAFILVVAFFVAALVWPAEKWPENVKDARTYPYVADGAKWLHGLIPEEALKNLGLKATDKDEEEGSDSETSLEHIVKSLSQPTPSKTEEKDKEEVAEQDG